MLKRAESPAVVICEHVRDLAEIVDHLAKLFVRLPCGSIASSLVGSVLINRLPACVVRRKG